MILLPSRCPLGCGLLLVGMLAFTVAHAEPPPLPRPLPGQSIGTAESRWVAPYVLATRYQVGGSLEQSVRWFDDSGKVTRELKGSIDCSWEYISERRKGKTFVYGLSGQWQFELPERPSMHGGGSLTGAGDTFLFQYSPAQDETMLDVYQAGILKASLGPYLPFRGFQATLGEDGSIAQLAYRSPEKKDLKIVVVAPGGKLSFVADCAPDVNEGWPMEDGRAVLLRIEEAEPGGRFYYLPASGQPQTLSIGGDPLHAIGRDGKVIFYAGLGFKLVDCANGKVIWEIPSPIKSFDNCVPLSFLVSPRLVVFYGKDFAAVNAETGEIIARWKPNTKPVDFGRIIRRGDRLFFVSDSGFSEIKEKDILSHADGWE